MKSKNFLYALVSSLQCNYRLSSNGCKSSMPNVPPFLERVQDLNRAILAENSLVIELLLADSEVQVNMDLLAVKLPLKTMLEKLNSFLAKHFPNCPRIDWLAMTHPRNVENAERDFGFPIERDTKGRNKLSASSGPVVNNFDYFHYLDKIFEAVYPNGAAEIYDKIISELVKIADTQDYTRLLFNTLNSVVAFHTALKYCTPVNARDEKGRTHLHVIESSDLIPILLAFNIPGNAVDENGETALMAQARAGRWSIVKRLVILANINGTGLDFVNSKGLSWFSVAKSQEEFLQLFDLSEPLFLAELKLYNAIDYKILDVIFLKNPSFKMIFLSNLPEFLPAIKDCPEVPFWRSQLNSRASLRLTFLKPGH